MEKKITFIETAPPRRQPKVLLQAFWRPRRAPEDGPEKMQSLVQAVQTNTYRIDCRKLADCLIASLLMGLLR
jgi:hypothetical protein